jgi:hypothetical protein
VAKKKNQDPELNKELVKNPSLISADNISRLKKNESYDDLLKMIDKEVEKSTSLLAPWKQRVVKYYELYKMYQRKKHYEGLAQLFVPEILRAVETIVGNLFRRVTVSDPWFEYKGRTPDSDAAAAAETMLVRYQMDENGFKHRLMDSLRQMVITGLTCRKISWDFQLIERTRRNYDTGSKRIDPETNKLVSFKRWQEEKFLDTVRDHWTFEPVDLLSLLIPDPSIPYNEMEKSRWITEQYMVDEHWIQEKMKKGWFIEVDDEDYCEDEGAPRDGNGSQMFKDSRIASSGFSSQLMKDNDDRVEIIERWGLLSASYVYTAEQMKERGYTEEDLVETVLVIANRKAILKLEANPFYHGEKPYVFCPYVPQEYEFDGIGAAQIAESLQEELNDTRNQTMDNKTLILMNMWLRDRTSQIKKEDLRVRPNGVIDTNDMNGLRPLSPPVLSGVGVNIEAVIKDDLRESVAASSNMQGIAQSGIGSATESAAITAAGQGRLDFTAIMYGELVLKKTLMMVQYLNNQFYDHSKLIRIVGPLGMHYKKISPKDIEGYKDVVLNISTDGMSSPASQRQQYLQLLSIIGPMSPEQMQFHWKLLDEIYKKSFGGRCLSDLYTGPEDAAYLLDVQSEVDLIRAGYPAMPQKRDDASQRAAELEKEFEKYKWALSPQQMENFKNLILGYEKMGVIQAKAAQQQQQMMMAQMVQNGQMAAGTGTPGNPQNIEPPINPAQGQGA